VALRDGRGTAAGAPASAPGGRAAAPAWPSA
jgi:hypothetical protein